MSCQQCLSDHLCVAEASIPELPGRHDTIRWPREWHSQGLDAQDTFVLATAEPFTFVALYEHSAAFREAFAAHVHASASVADRPSALPPSANAAHFIVDVLQWLQAYPFSIPFATANPSCVSAAIAAINSAKPRLLRNLRNGNVLASLREQCIVLSCARFIAMEQPPSLFEFALGLL